MLVVLTTKLWGNVIQQWITNTNVKSIEIHLWSQAVLDLHASFVSY